MTDVSNLIKLELPLSFCAHSMVTQTLSVDDAPESITLEEFESSIPGNVIINPAGDELTFIQTGDYMISADFQTERTGTGVASAWFGWFEVNFGLGWTEIPFRGTATFFNNTSTGESNPVHSKPFVLSVARPGLQFRVRQQTDVASTLTGIRAFAKNAPSMPVDVPSCVINGTWLWPFQGI